MNYSLKQCSMRSAISKTAFSILLASSLSAQPEFSMTGPSQGRFGMSTSINFQIIRKSVRGPVRLVAEVPENWSFITPLVESALYSQTGQNVRAVWLDFPIKDTVICSMQLAIPETHRGNVVIKAHLEYFSNGEKKQVGCAPFPINIRKYYSRL